MTEERPKKVIINCETGEQTVIDFTDEEITEMEQRRAEVLAREAQAEAAAQAAAEAKASALAKLAALGLTEAEAAAIVGN